ncbi:MAG: hypothetical protein ACI4Q4_10120, partial [Oscillospiraceae bacterium]
VLNPFFSHGGEHALFFVGDAAFTLEALAYGAAFGLMLASALLWGSFSTCFMTSDKYIWLFGRAFPAAGLTLSCALRFVPLFISRTREFFAARRDSSLRGMLKAFAASVGYSAEQALVSAQGMRSRGYGSGKRTFYSLWRFTARDAFQLSAVTVLGIISAVLGSFAGKFYYYPALGRLPLGAADVALYLLYGLLCVFPVIVILSDRRRAVSS